MPCVGYKAADEGRISSTYNISLGGSDEMACSIATSTDMTGSAAVRVRLKFDFWAIHNLACQNRLAEAKLLFEHVLSFANDLGLFGEEIDPETGAAPGNFPQAFTHVGLINAAIAIERAGNDRGC